MEEVGGGKPPASLYEPLFFQYLEIKGWVSGWVCSPSPQGKEMLEASRGCVQSILRISHEGGGVFEGALPVAALTVFV